ncbi:chemotaxis protein CheV [Amphritea opalescens]|uniref:Chemotaxis protein CheV n=1 Tax=Amphritea opalescens TaxID=2490544 RepID=A0A430KTV2_9GAMM|nr:chemotaxis protein CheV [Amphritea opalescens]RTE66878.1 chemotaxis protein CheV [Amphritea opalescens]
MSGINSTVNQRTNMAGQNRLELLLFGLNDDQIYGINVFKVREVLTCPELTGIPKQTTALKGLAHIRGETIPVIDLSQAIGGTPVDAQERLDCFLIVSEYNRRVLAFLVRNVDRILPAKWDQVSPPPIETKEKNYLTAVVQFEGGLIEILDVEQVLADLIPVSTDLKSTTITDSVKKSASGYRILVVDDSSVARTQVKKALENLNINVVTANDGQAALDMLTQLADKEQKLTDTFLMVISDIEMPQMDGYTLVKRIREDIRLRSLYVMLHSSLSGRFNLAMVKRVGADAFIGKFNPDELADAVIKRIESIEG